MKVVNIAECSLGAFYNTFEHFQYVYVKQSLPSKPI